MWCFLAEYSLSKFLDEPGTGDWTASGLLSQTVQELGIPVECINHIGMTLRSFAREALAHYQQERTDLPGRIRIFCQKKLVDNVYSAKTSRTYHTEHAMEHAQLIIDSGKKMNGGWGYFIIERSGGEAGSSERSSLLVDLYLYQEEK